MRAVDLRGSKRRSEVDSQLIGAVPDPAERAFLLQNLMLERCERSRWRLNLEAIERGFLEISGFRSFPPVNELIRAQPCSLRAPAPTISVPSTRTHNPTAVSRRRGSRESRAPGIGSMPSSRRHFCKLSDLFCPAAPKRSIPPEPALHISAETYINDYINDIHRSSCSVTEWDSAEDRNNREKINRVRQAAEDLFKPPAPSR